jgi:hypothetical protein
MNLVDLIAAADGRALAVTGLGCLDRCLPLLGGDDDVLRPLWSSLANGDGWPERLAAARAALKNGVEQPGAPDGQRPEDNARALVSGMLTAAPDALPPGLTGPADAPEHRQLHHWADACSLAALRVHSLLDVMSEPSDIVAERRTGRTDGMPPLVEAELRRQTGILELLAGHGPGALRQALEATTEGRRVLRAAVSRRARAR